MERFRLHYTPAVAAELLKEFPSGREFWKLVREEALFEVVSGLGQVTEFGLGERAAMNLALEHRDWLLLIDDQRPFQEAVRLNLRALCTPVLVVQLYVEGRLDARQALKALARLAVMQTVSPALLAAALAQLGVAWREKG
jgi:predicted nucleic acid-binding protein